MMTISPGSMSRTNSASMRSNAVGSLATTWASLRCELPDPGRMPRHSGRMPIGSRTARMVSSVMNSSE